MESVLYIGTDKGVITARSRDGGSWQITDRGLKNWDIPEVAVAPGAPNKVFAGTRGDGVFVSEDFGKTWKKPCYGKRGPGKVRSVTIDPHDPRRIYAGCEPIDVFVSEDEGKNWTRLDSVWGIPFVATVPYPVASVEPHVRDVVVDPKDPKTIYAALQVGYILKSTNGGKSWTLLDKNVDCDVHTIVIDPVDTKRIVIATGGHDARLKRAPGRALYLSEDGGQSWTPTAMNFTHEYSVPLTPDPRDPKRLFTALGNGQPGQWRRRDSGAESTMIQSIDGGKSWTQLGQGIDSHNYPEAITVDDAFPGRIYAACRNGEFFASDDGGESWRAMDLGLGVSDLSSVTIAHA
jgi:photosystem II stability/assembly factor-like uncharacterized protein